MKRVDGFDTRLVLLLALVGLCYAFVVPPLRVPDEREHFLRAYHVSEGHCLPQIKLQGWGGASLPASLRQLERLFNPLADNSPRHISGDEYRKIAAVALDPGGPRNTFAFGGQNSLTFVPYLPQAVGIALARSAGAGVYGVFLASRLSNLLFALIVILLTLRLAPTMQQVFMWVAFSPVITQSFASASADTSAIVLCLFTTALALRLALPDVRPVRRSELAIALISCVWLTLCKLPYGCLGILFLAVPWERLGGRRRALALHGLAILVLVITAWVALIPRKNCPEKFTGPGYEVSPAAQGEKIRANPAKFLAICLVTLMERGGDWLDASGLGYQDTPMSPLAVRLFGFVVILLSFLDRSPRAPTSAALGCAALAGVGTVSLLIFVALHMGWSPVGYGLIKGLQPRYFLPLLPALLIPVWSRHVVFTGNRRQLSWLLAGAGIAVQICALEALISHYFLPLTRITAYCLAVILAVTCLTLALRRAAGAGEETA
jgi:hypothetical protein